MKVYLKYSFIFDPATTWNSKEQFNTDLGLYFQSKGYTAEIIKSALDNPEELLIYLDRLPEQQVPPPPTKPQDITVKKAFSDLTKGRDFKGKFTKQNG